MWRLLAHVANKRRFNLVQFALHVRQQFMERRWEIVWICTHNFFRRRFDAGELVSQHRLEQRDLAREMRVERFLAYAQLCRQIINAHAPEPVSEEISPRLFS